MAEGDSRVPDVNELYQRMGERLGWFQKKQNKGDNALCGSSKKKKVHSVAEGSEKKLVKKKPLSCKTTKVRKQAMGNFEDNNKLSKKNTPAHGYKAHTGSSGITVKNNFEKCDIDHKPKAKPDFNLSSSDDDESLPNFPVKRTPAHTNLPKTLGLADNVSDSYSHKGRKCHKSALNGFDLSSSDDEIETKNDKHKTINACSNEVASEMENTAGLLIPADSKPRRVKVSDSFVEKVEVDDTYVSCIGESFVELDVKGRVRNENPDKLYKASDKVSVISKNPNSIENEVFSVDDTIVQKPIRISSESFSPDMDITFGQPPCESTRIHRRSSVSYKRLIGSPDKLNSSDSSDGDKHYETCRPNVSSESENGIEDPLVEAAHDANRTKNVHVYKKTLDEKKQNELNMIVSNRSKNDICSGLQDLKIEQHDGHKNSESANSKHDHLMSENHQSDIASREESFDEIVEVVCTQTDLNVSDKSISPLKQSFNENSMSENQKKGLRKNSDSSFQSIRESEDSSDVSEVEIKDVSIQTEPCLNILEDGNMNQSDNNIEDSDKGEANSEETISQEQSEITEDNSEQGLFESKSNDTNSENETSENIKGVVSETKKNEMCSSECEENASGISDVESSDGSVEEVVDLSSELENVNRTEDVKLELLKSGREIENEKSDKKKLLTLNREDDQSIDIDKKGNDSDEIDSKQDSFSLESENEKSFKTNESNKKIKLKRKGVQCIKKDKERAKSCESDISNEPEICQDYQPDTAVHQNTWRQRKVSDSSSEEDLDAYFEKLRNPKQSNMVRSSSSEASPVSMKDFIVDDDDMTSESDDNNFYIKENRKLDEAPQTGRQKIDIVNFSDSDDSDFSTDKYPGSVTKHKKKLTAKHKTRRKSWSFSSDDSDSDDGHSVAKGFNKIQSEVKNDSESSDSDSILDDSKKPDQKTETKTKPVKGLADIVPVVSEEVLFKTPKPLIRVTKKTSNKENVPEGIFKTPKSSHDSTEVFKTPKLNTDTGRIFKTPKSNHDVKTQSEELTKKNERSKSGKMTLVTLSDSDDDLPNITPPVLKEVTTNTKLKSKSLTDEDLLRTPSSVSTGKNMKFFTPQPVQTGYNFLKSLSSAVQDSRRDSKAARFVNGFKKTKEELTQYLFRLYNQTVFENQLPSDLPIEWNNRLLRTAGYCTYKKSSKNPSDRSVKIELSTKVCDSAERVRDTLIHELCHAAVWLVNETRDGHGRFWKYWARKANHAHPEIPVIARCHDYSINTKYTYQCTQCGYRIGRHSKSLDTEKKVCGYCYGQFELLQNSGSLSSSGADPMTPKTPRTPNRFALYVKEHYSAVKKRDKNLKHGDVMKELSKQFAEMNKI